MTSATVSNVKNDDIPVYEHNKGIKWGRVVYHVLVMAGALIMIYPIVWMLFSSFKPTETVFTTADQLIPTTWTGKNYVTGFIQGISGISFWTFLGNSIFISVVATIGTIGFSAIVAYALARLKFRGRGVLFTAMLLSMMLPAQVLMVPQYLWYQKLGWTNSYLPLIVPYWFCIQGFFVYLMYNFIQGIPRSLDEAAKIDGCSYYGIFFRVVVPLLTPAVVTGCIFSFMWRWDDFLSALLYVADTERFPVSLALKLFSDPSSSTDYGAIFAMASVSILPSILIFLFFQKYLVEGVSTSGLKG